SKGNQNIKKCEPVNIDVEIKNAGKSDMKQDSSYEVYYIENGNPKKHGEIVKLAEDEGVIPVLKQGETTKLTYQASKEGRYIFLANQSDSQHKESIWRKEIKGHCKSKKKRDAKEKVGDTQKQTKT